jgi:acetyl-CoA synthetase
LNYDLILSEGHGTGIAELLCVVICWLLNATSGVGMEVMEKRTDSQDGRRQNGSPPSRAGSIGAERSHWQSIRAELEEKAAGCGPNMAHAAVTRHAHGVEKGRAALRCLSGEEGRREWTFAELERDSNRVANVFKGLGLAPGHVVATLCGRVPELYLTALGTLKTGAVYCALYASYGPEPVVNRLVASNAAVLVTSRRLYDKISDLRPRMPGLRHILLIDDSGIPDQGIHSLTALMADASDDFAISVTAPETPALVHFTSGTTGMPKGVVHVHEAALHYILTSQAVFDLHAPDVYWCTADPGWVTGVVYGFLAPLMAGVTTIVDQDEFDAQRWLRILSEEHVTVWYTSPSALRRLMNLPFRPCRRYDLKALRLVFSVGEPLHAAAVTWGQEALGVPIRDTWWQTETGGIMIANHPGEAVQPGAMGRPVDGILAEVLQPATAGGMARVCGPGKVGELALAAGWPSMFRRLLGDPQAYRRRFRGRWYLSGDLVRRDADGIYWFVGRSDDMIKTSGHMVSPFEVERVLLEYPDVYEAGVVGIPDKHLGQRVKAYVSLQPGSVADESLRGRILAFARQRLGPALAPREIAFTETLPRNRAGKIVRKELLERP